MASSGTVSAPVIDLRFKPNRGREEVIIAGRVKVKSTAQIEAGDFTLRTIKGAVLTPFATEVHSGAHMQIYGSLSMAGSLMNALTTRVIKGTLRQGNVPAIGTASIGTVLSGTLMTSFIIHGA